MVAFARLDADRARLTLWLIALSPAAMFFSYPPVLGPFFHWDADAYGYIAHHGALAVLQVLLAGRQGLFLHFFISVPRYVAVIFPCYFAFATLLGRRRNLQITWLLISATSMVVNAALYGAWRFLG